MFLDIYKVITITKINKIIRCGNRMEILISMKPADSSEHYNYNIVRKKSMSVWFLSLEVIPKDRTEVQILYSMKHQQGKKELIEEREDRQEEVCYYTNYQSRQLKLIPMRKLQKKYKAGTLELPQLRSEGAGYTNALIPITYCL